MGIDRALLEQLTNHVIKRLSNRIANTVSRGVVKLANDAKKLQLLQLGVLAGETIDNAEHFQPYGFSSVPLDGAEAVVLFPNGDRSHPIVIGAPDRRHRPTGGEAGQVGLYHYVGQLLTMLASGNIELQAAGAGVIKLSNGGTVESTIKGDTYRSAEDTMLTALGAAFTAAATGFTNLGQTAAASACTAAAAAITTFQASAAAYKTTVAKVQ